MKIFRGNIGHVDFPHAIKMTELQKERFINFLKNSFDVIEIIETNKVRRFRMGEKVFAVPWEDKESNLLAKIDEDNNSLSRKLGRAWMSVEMRRLFLIPSMLNYAAKKGIDIYKVDIKQLVNQFLEEHRDEIRDRRNEKNRKREEKETLEVLKKRKILLEQGLETEETEGEYERICERMKEIENFLSS